MIVKQNYDELKVQNASAILGTKLRKYLATVSPLSNFSENQNDWLTRQSSS